MTLTEIKNKIIEELAKLTVDDFYCSAANCYAKQAFFEITKLRTDEEILKYLSGRFPETIAEILQFSLKDAIEKKISEIKSIEIEIKHYPNNVDTIDKKIENKKGELGNISIQQKQVESKLAEIEAEIKQITPLAEKIPYGHQLVVLEERRKITNTALEETMTRTSNLKGELKDLLSLRKSKTQYHTKLKSEINVLQSSIEILKQELVKLKEKEQVYFKNEYSALEFLFRILLGSTISKQELTKLVHKDTGKLWNDYIHNFSSWEREHKIKNGEQAEVKTGEVKLVVNTSNPDRKSDFELECSFTNSKCVIPKDWRDIVNQILSKPIPELSGTLAQHTYLKREGLKLTDLDLTTLLATKIAIRSKHSILTAKNKIVLALSGGLAAIISFREKSKLIANFQEQPTEIYANCLSTKRYSLKELYHQTGYADSSIEIKLPNAYYILSERFVIEIYYTAAPALFDNNSIIKFAPNISGKAKSDYEAEEENRRRQQEEDERYYYDD